MSFPRTTHSNGLNYQRAILATLGLALLPAPVSAALSVYEPFNYTALASLGGQNGGTGFSGAWTATTGTSTVNTPGLTFGSLTVVGNRATTAAATATTQTRGLSAALGSVTGTTYFSFVLRPDNTAAGNNAEFALVGGTASLFIGKPVNGNNYVLDTTATGGTQNASSTAYTSGTAVLMVLRADFVSAGADTFKLFINPNNSAEPGVADATKSAYDVGTVSTIQFNGNLGFSIDELKIGSSYADVVPESGTWGSMIAVLGIGGIAWLRQRAVRRAAKAASASAVPVAH